MKKFIGLLFTIFLTYSYGVGKIIENQKSIEDEPLFYHLLGKSYKYSASFVFLKLPSDDYEYNTTVGILLGNDNFSINLSYLNLNGEFISSEGNVNTPNNIKLSISHSHIFGSKNSLNNLATFSSINLDNLASGSTSMYGVSLSVGLFYFDTLPTISINGNENKRYNLSFGTAIENLGFHINNGELENINFQIKGFFEYKFITFREWNIGITLYPNYGNIKNELFLGIKLVYLTNFNTSARYDALNNRIFFDNSISIPLDRYLIKILYSFGISQLGSSTMFNVEFDF
jgi:hypothetical protein